jgi:hypothetical protein
MAIPLLRLLRLLLHVCLLQWRTINLHSSSSRTFCLHACCSCVPVYICSSRQVHPSSSSSSSSGAAPAPETAFSAARTETVAAVAAHAVGLRFGAESLLLWHLLLLLLLLSQCGSQ